MCRMGSGDRNGILSAVRRVERRELGAVVGWSEGSGGRRLRQYRQQRPSAAGEKHKRASASMCGVDADDGAGGVDVGGESGGERCCCWEERVMCREREGRSGPGSGDRCGFRCARTGVDEVLGCEGGDGLWAVDSSGLRATGYGLRAPGGICGQCRGQAVHMAAPGPVAHACRRFKPPRPTPHRNPCAPPAPPTNAAVTFTPNPLECFILSIAPRLCAGHLPRQTFGHGHVAVRTSRSRPFPPFQNAGPSQPPLPAAPNRIGPRRSQVTT